MNQERKLDRLAVRTAGSHSPFDVISIDAENANIFLIQSKPDSMNEKEKEKIETENIELNGVFWVKFKVV